NRNLIGPLGKSRKRPAECDTGDLRRQLPRRTADAGRRGHLGIEHLDLARAAMLEKKDDRLPRHQPAARPQCRRTKERRPGHAPRGGGAAGRKNGGGGGWRGSRGSRGGGPEKTLFFFYPHPPMRSIGLAFGSATISPETPPTPSAIRRSAFRSGRQLADSR